MFNKKRIPQYSLFGFKILNSWHSIQCAYILLLFEYFLTPYFGIEKIQYTAGSLFISLVNVSAIILILNSFVRYTRVIALLTSLYVPLLIWFPFSIKKIFIVFSNLMSL